ncbi:hypothetical protein [Mycoplasmopsis arginini]|uniref:hypothetical protein n=1 Tax=Mycoplasmopsis arginini TaxID=2094 RepID=UPI000A27E08E|nr:hypothetical protein [Mycoplasmopsis arginini]SGA02699.1 Uncharacterised protein [Chlamydia abortus]SGA21780.1 Uncharacterised protein [Mycoplasmopsis arginini]
MAEKTTKTTKTKKAGIALREKITKDFEKTGTIKAKDLNKLVQEYKNSKKK